MKKYILGNLIGFLVAILVMLFMLILYRIFNMEESDFFIGWISGIVYIEIRNYYIKNYGKEQIE